MRTITISVFAVAASVMVTSTAAAQMKWLDTAVVAVNVGFQGGSHTLMTDEDFSLYEETGTLTSSQKVGGGAFFDLSAGRKVWRNLVIGVGFSRVASKDTAAITAAAPDPGEFDRHREVTATLGDSKHSENAIHFSGTWMVPVTDKIDVGVSAGPTVFMVKQDIPSALTVTEPGPSVASVTRTQAKKTTVGLNMGVDVTYLLTPKIGVGGIARYTWGSADFDGPADSLTLGGFQIGAGLRYRF